MRKLLVTMAVLAMAAILLTACNTCNENTLEDNVRDYLHTPNAELVLVGRENPEWLDYTCSQYIAKIDGKWYTLGVQHDGNSVHYVDIEGEL